MVLGWLVRRPARGLVESVVRGELARPIYMVKTLTILSSTALLSSLYAFLARLSDSKCSEVEGRVDDLFHRQEFHTNIQVGQEAFSGFVDSLERRRRHSRVFCAATRLLFSCDGISDHTLALRCEMFANEYVDRVMKDNNRRAIEVTKDVATRLREIAGDRERKKRKWFGLIRNDDLVHVVLRLKEAENKLTGDGNGWTEKGQKLGMWSGMKEKLNNWIEKGEVNEK